MSLSFSKSLAISLKGLMGRVFQLIGDLTRQLDRQYIFNACFAGFVSKTFPGILNWMKQCFEFLELQGFLIQIFSCLCFVSFDCIQLIVHFLPIGRGIVWHRCTFCSLKQVISSTVSYISDIYI